MAHRRRPVFLPPASPSELLSYILSHHRHPTILLIGTGKQQFLQALLEDTRPPPPLQEPSEQGNDTPPHELLRATLHQVAVSRHIRIAFIPTVTHLRAYLATFSSSESAAHVCAPPPASVGSTTGRDPLLLVYGFLDLHRLTSEWSAQGIGDSAAALVEAATGGEGSSDNHLRPAIIEPKTIAGLESGESLEELIPVLSGMSRREDGTWIGRTVEARRILWRWFEEDNIN